MERLRKKFQIMSVNQLAIYHTLLEGYNIVKKSSSEQIQLKWTEKSETNCILRSAARNDIKIPIKPTSKCTGFSYTGAKLYNLLPKEIRETQSSSLFKCLTKRWIWMNIPSH